MDKHSIYKIPFLIALSNGILSVFGLSAGFEHYFFLAAILSAVIVLGRNQHSNLFQTSLIMGVLIAAATGIPQALFMDTYFQNNPDYVDLGNSLPLNPRTYTFVMIPVFGAAIGLVITGLTWLLVRILKR